MESSEHASQRYLIWPQRHSSSAPSTEFCLAIWTEVATAIGKLGFVAYPAGWGFALLILSLLRLLPHLLNLVLIRFKLLVQLPVKEKERTDSQQKGNMIGSIKSERLVSSTVTLSHSIYSPTFICNVHPWMVKWCPSKKGNKSGPLFRKHKDRVHEYFDHRI